LDQTELRAEITRLHKLISEAAQQAKEYNVPVTLIDKLTSAQIRIELLLKKLRPTAKP
jgi:16S rRNA U1498 N3-methylase RsmE